MMLTCAKFIPYAATLTHLWVEDRDGHERDVVLGYDNTSYYRTLFSSLFLSIDES